MGTITGQQILDNVRAVSNMDTTRWSDADALKLLNEALRDLMMLQPQANPVTAKPTLQAGTRQTLSGLSLTTGIQVIDVVRNFDITGATAGIAVRRIPGGRRWMDQYHSDWHNAVAASADIRHFMTDEEDPETFWVWPPSNGNGKVELIYSAMPTAFSALSSAISIHDRYANPLGYLLLARMYSRNEPGTLSYQAVQDNRALAATLLGVTQATIKRLDRSTDEGPS